MDDLPVGIGSTSTDHVLTETATSNTVTSEATGDGKINSNHAQPTDVPTATPRLPENSDSDVILSESSGESDGDSDYADLPQNLPIRFSNLP